MNDLEKLTLLQDIDDSEQWPNGKTIIILRNPDGSYEYKGKVITDYRYKQLCKSNDIILFRGA
jgi:hypothetical protein